MDFNAEMTNSYLEEFWGLYNLKNLIKQPTCFNNLENPTCIDHILTSHPKSFHSSSVFEIGLSDFHKLTLTVLKFFLQRINLELSKTEISIILIMHQLEQIFLRSYLFKMFSLKNLKNLNTFPRKYLILMPQ